MHRVCRYNDSFGLRLEFYDNSEVAQPNNSVGFQSRQSFMFTIRTYHITNAVLTIDPISRGIKNANASDTPDFVV